MSTDTNVAAVDTSSKQDVFPKKRGRWRKGVSGNPNGRPFGSRNKTTIAIESILGAAGPEVAERGVLNALNGDNVAIWQIIDRCAPKRRGRAISFRMPEITDAVSALKAQALVLQEVADGNLTLEEAESFSLMLNVYLKGAEAITAKAPGGVNVNIMVTSEVAGINTLIDGQSL